MSPSFAGTFCGTPVALTDLVFLADAGTNSSVNLMEQVPSLTSNGAQDTFYPDWHWSLGGWRRKVGHEGNE
jgi:hypothetical protein